MDGKIKVLLIEDDKIDQMAFERLVGRENLPYDYQIARSVSQAREILAAERFDVLLMDYLLGDGTAFDLFDATGDMPVIMLTGSGDEAVAVQAMKAGAYDYLIKDPEGNYLTTLAVTVENVTNHRHNEEELERYREHLEELVVERTVELTRANKQLRAEIGERKKAEEALRQSEALLNVTQRLARIGGWEWDVAAQTMIWTEEVYRIHGIEPGEIALLGPEYITRSLECYDAPDRPVILAAFQRCAEQGTAYDLEFPFTTAKGRRLWIHTTASAVMQGDRVVKVVGHIMDITARKQAEEERTRLIAEIREQAQQLRQVMSAVPEGMLLLNGEQRLVMSNPVAGQALAILSGEKRGQALTHLGNRPIAELLTSPPPGQWHEVSAGQQVFEVIARPVDMGPHPEGWVLVIHDVTQEREVEKRIQQQERLAAVGQLAAGIAHDFNNIMAVIVLYTQMTLHEPELSPKTCERLETVSRQARRATDLIQQILDFSRRAVLERRPMDLVPFLKELTKLLQRTLPDNIQVNLKYGADEYTLNADPTRIQQAVMNMAINARDAMPEGGRFHIDLERIHIEDRKQAPLPEMEGGNWLRLSLTDTGSGVPPDVVGHIFEPFFTTKAPGQGSGLGLAQVWGIVQQHQGHIDVTTQVGHGTTFTVYLPALLESKPQAVELPVEEIVKGRGELVLIVEDDSVTREVLTESLALLDYRTLTAANGREALAILEMHHDEIALVLSDLVMPDMGGRALLHALRQRNLPVPMVMLTGHPMEKELEMLSEQGLRGWLLKPPSLEQLARMLASALGQQ